MTLITPTTTLVSLIQDAQRARQVSVYKRAADFESATPAGLLCVAVGFEDIQLVLETVRPITDVFGYTAGTAYLKGMTFPVSAKEDGHAPTRILVQAGLLEQSHKLGQIITVLFEPWGIQQRGTSLVVAASGTRYCDMLDERLTPALEREQKLRQEIGAASYKDLPADMIPKGEE
jgi:hypothetical protein